MEDIHPEFFKGLACFNQADFFQAHEHFEQAWRDTADDSREFYRALLHLSAGYFRLAQNRPAAAKKFFNHAKKWLALFANPTMGLDTEQINLRLGILIQSIDQGQDAKVLLNQSFPPLQRKGSREE